MTICGTKGKDQKLSTQRSISTWKREEERRWIRKRNRKKKMLVEFKIVESESDDESEIEEETKSEDENEFLEDREGLF